MADGNFNGLPIPYKITEDPTTKADKSTTINGLDLSANRVLKSAQFSEAMTGEKMLAGLTYREVSEDTIDLGGSLALDESAVAVDSNGRKLSDGAIDISSLFVWNSGVTYSTNNIVAFYHPASKTVSGNIVFETSGATNAGTTYATIPSAYRPSSNTQHGCIYYNVSTGGFLLGTLYFRSNGNVNQSITNNWKGCVCSFEYKVE